MKREWFRADRDTPLRGKNISICYNYSSHKQLLWTHSYYETYTYYVLRNDIKEISWIHIGYLLGDFYDKSRLYWTYWLGPNEYVDKIPLFLKIKNTL